MLYDLSWLEAGQVFPPPCEAERIQRYRQNACLFDGDHFADSSFRHRDCFEIEAIEVYKRCASRISQVVGNFEDVISFPTLLNYQRLMSLKMADLVCGEHPSISGSNETENAAISLIRDSSDFDAKLYSTVIDMSRYGDAVWRIYKDYDGNNNFTCWEPTMWYPIVAQDGTCRVTMHCLCWVANLSKNKIKPDWRLYVQLHSCDKVGYYEQREYKISDATGTIGKQVSTTMVATGLTTCGVVHLRPYTVTGTVYGYDDYVPLDSLLAEIMARVGQISSILDKHADPCITGPASMLERNPETGEYYLKTGKFYAVSPGEEQPSYMTWDGHLTSAFKQLELLLNQLYILSEMGAAILGGQDGSSQAISGTAMRFKMVNPLAKARRIANALSRPVRRLFESLSETAQDIEKVAFKNISILWSDGLPEDPRENIENCKLATGAAQMMPLETAIMEFFNRSNAEAVKWLDKIQEERAAMEDYTDPNKPGPQDGTGVNSSKKGSETSLNNFHGLNN